MTLSDFRTLKRGDEVLCDDGRNMGTGRVVLCLFGFVFVRWPDGLFVAFCALCIAYAIAGCVYAAVKGPAVETDPERDRRMVKILEQGELR